jgi:hypothetical protein
MPFLERALDGEFNRVPLLGQVSVMTRMADRASKALAVEMNCCPDGVSELERSCVGSRRCIAGQCASPRRHGPAEEP